MDETNDETSRDGGSLAEYENLPEATLPSSCLITIRGWENNNNEEVQGFGAGVISIASDLSRVLDLSRLESIVIGWDYAKALASVNRGDGAPPAAPTSNEYGQGNAMAVHVFRDDELWSVVVIWTGLVRQPNQADHPDHKLALQTFVHELVHVADLCRFTRTYQAVGAPQNPGTAETPRFR
jgi:hypothetical protein